VGTLVATALALRDQTNAGLVLLSGYYFPSARLDGALMSWPALPIVGDILRYTLSPFIGRLMAPMLYRKMFAPAPVSAPFARAFPVELAVRPSQIRASAEETALMVPGAASMVQRYPKLSMPIAIMAGDGDRIVDFNPQAGRLNAILDRSTLCKVPGVGHMIHHTVPHQIAAIVRDITREPMTSLSSDSLA
jgi:pimeloyl-ACP methyl ester carboxylesterase